MFVCLSALQGDGQGGGASEGRTGRAGAAHQGPAGQDLRRPVQHTEERGEDPEDGDRNQLFFQNLKGGAQRQNCPQNALKADEEPLAQIDGRDLKPWKLSDGTKLCT